MELIRSHGELKDDTTLQQLMEYLMTLDPANYEVKRFDIKYGDVIVQETGIEPGAGWDVFQVGPGPDGGVPELIKDLEGKNDGYTWVDEAVIEGCDGQTRCFIVSIL